MGVNAISVQDRNNQNILIVRGSQQIWNLIPGSKIFSRSLRVMWSVFSPLWGGCSYLQLWPAAVSRELPFISLCWWVAWDALGSQSSFAVTSSVRPGLNSVPLAEISSACCSDGHAARKKNRLLFEKSFAAHFLRHPVEMTRKKKDGKTETSCIYLIRSHTWNPMPG